MPETLDVEIAWLEKAIRFTDTEMEGRERAGSTDYWKGAVARFEASVGQAPTARTEPVYRLTVEGYEQFERAATGANPNGVEEGTRLFGLAAEQMNAIAAGNQRADHEPGRETASASLPFQVPSGAEVKFASAAIVKRRKTSYGKPGLLMLAGDRLTFLTRDPVTSWQVAVSDIAHLKKPWYGMGSYLTCDVNGAYYAFAFGRRGMDLAGITSASGLAIGSGGAAGAAGGLAGEAVAVSAIVDGARLGGEWFSRLTAAAAARGADRAVDSTGSGS